MKRFLSIIIFALLITQLSSATTEVEYSVEMNGEYKWKVDYVVSKGTGSSFEETIINGTIFTSITEVSDQGVSGDLTTIQYTDEDLSDIYGLVKLLEGNGSNQLISVAGNVTDIIFNDYDELVPFIWPINEAYWEMIIPNFNRTYTPDYAGQVESSRFILTDVQYIIEQFKDYTPVDGGRHNSSITINIDTGLMEELIISESYFYTLNPPVITNLKITLVDNDYTFPENINSLNYTGFSLSLVSIAVISLIVRSTKNRKQDLN